MTQVHETIFTSWRTVSGKTWQIKVLGEYLVRLWILLSLHTFEQTSASQNQQKAARRRMPHPSWVQEWIQHAFFYRLDVLPVSYPNRVLMWKRIFSENCLFAVEKCISRSAIWQQTGANAKKLLICVPFLACRLWALGSGWCLLW